MPLSNQNKVLLAKIETTAGTYNTPSASTDAVLCANARATYNGRVITTDEHTGSLDSDAPLVGGMTIGLSFECFLKGAGAAGTAPEFGKLLKACGLTETITAAAVGVPTAAAAGSTTTATLAAPAAATAQLYRGMPINFTGDQTSSSFITDYTAGRVATLTDTLVAITTSTNFQIPINVLYTPQSGTIPAVSFAFYQAGKLLKITGARGSCQLPLSAGGEGRIIFTFSGMLVETPSDVAVPAATFDSTRPPLFKNATFKLNRTATPLQALTLELGNTVSNPDNPNALEGFDPAEITKRAISGSINPMATLIADRDALSDFRAGTQRIVHARLGSTAGNRVGITIPKAQYTGFAESERGGHMTEDLPFAAVGQDAGFGLCFY